MLACALAVAACVGAPVPEKPLPLFLLTGQSNALGETSGDTVPEYDTPHSADREIRLFWDNKVDASTDLGASTAFVDIQEQQGGYYVGNDTHWGPEIGIARYLYDQGYKRFGFVKVARGGGGNTHWDKASAGHMYTDITGAVTTATAALLAAGVPFRFVGLVYLQGESNSTAEATAAQTRFEDLLTNLRTDLPNAAQMFGFIMGIAASSDDRDTTRTGHAAAASGDSTIYYQDNTDLVSLLPDGVHFAKAEKITIAERTGAQIVTSGVLD